MSLVHVAPWSVEWRISPSSPTTTSELPERITPFDDKLAAVVGSQALPRSELTKKLWNYIKKHGLQDKKRKAMINADDSLRPVFNGESQVSMFEMTKVVSRHMK